MTEFKKDTEAKEKRFNKTFVILVLLAALLMLLGIGMLVFALKLYNSQGVEYVETSEICETQSITVLTHEIEKEPENFEEPATTPPIKLIDVPYINQTAKYPSGCESVSAVMALQFWGYQITPEDFIDNYLPKSPLPYTEGGKCFGYNPSKTFIGDPYSKSGWGCYFPVIRRCLNSIIDPEKNFVVTLHNTPIKELCPYIDNDIPVIIWATQGMNKPKKSQSWSLLDGNGIFTWVSPNHCLLLIGYDETGYYFNDPLTHKNCRYPADITEKRYNSMGKQALAIIKAEDTTE